MPRNYDGRIPTGKKIAGVLPSVFGNIQKAFDARPKNIFTLFLSLLNEQMRPFVEPVFFSNGVLTVKVKNPTLLSILSSQEKVNLLHTMRERLPKIVIQDIVFQTG